MYVAQLCFYFNPTGPPAAPLEAIGRLLSALRSNGQILGREFPLAGDGEAYRAFMMLPAADSLERRHANEWVARAHERLLEVGLRELTVDLVGESAEGWDACGCPTRTSLILYTTYVSLDGCLRCGDCFHPVPLYAVPPTANGEYHDVMRWQSDYQACDQLQMNCTTGERFGLREMSCPDSSLSRQGRAVCRKIEAGTGLPVFYYLHRHYGRSFRIERDRLCPACGGPWRLDTSLHDLFDFQCAVCRLLGRIPPTATDRVRSRPAGSLPGTDGTG